MNNDINNIHNNIIQNNIINNIIYIPTKFTKHKIEKKNNCLIIKKVYNK